MTFDKESSCEFLDLHEVRGEKSENICDKAWADRSAGGLL